MKVLRHTSVILNEGEQACCRLLAQRRHAVNRSNGTTDAKIGPQDANNIDLQGMGAEFAFCKAFNVWPDCSLASRSSQGGTDQCGDALYRGVTIDVKVTAYVSGRLLATRWKQSSDAIYVLMVGSFPTYRYVGAMAAVDLLQPWRLKDLGYGLSYVAEQHELTDLDALITSHAGRI